MKKFIVYIFLFCFLIASWFLYSEIFTSEAQDIDKITFSISKGESVSEVANRLEEKQIIRSAWLFKKYLSFKKLDREVREGDFEVTAPITLARVVESLGRPSQAERVVTILPGWNLRDVANYFVKEKIVSSTEDVYNITGLPAYDYKAHKQSAPQIFNDIEILKDKLDYSNLEGYLSPDTFRVFKDASLEDIIRKLLEHRDTQFTEQMYKDIKKSDRTVHEIIIMASILEREVRSEKDKKLVADLFWRRYDQNWALQADSTVHYLTGKSGDVFTTKEDRDSLSPWNTYRYPGLPLGPISNPSLESIMAAIYPEKNDYWYFLTDDKGKVWYAKTLEGHNLNRQKHL